MGRALENVLAVLNGAIGDHLARTNNGLATAMTLVDRGRPLPVERVALARACPSLASGRAVLLVHGLMCTETSWTLPDGEDYASLLARDLGFAPLRLRYNSGLAIPTNGRALADLLEALMDQAPAPIEEIVLVGHSMGGLVARSACQVALARGDRWLGRVRRAIYVGTPLRGAPLERFGRALVRVLDAIPDPYTRLAAQLAGLRSAGVRDLGDPAHPVPLLPGIAHHLVAGTVAAGDWLTALFGDAIVPLASATDGAPLAAASAAAAGADPAAAPRVRVFPGVAHLTLAHHPAVYEQLRAWCEAGP